MQFITLGNYTINLSTIAYIEWNWKQTIPPHKEYTRVWFAVPQGEEGDVCPDCLIFLVESREAKALRDYFKNPKTSQDLMKRLEMVEAIKS
jgi:hypothetical protein